MEGTNTDKTSGIPRLSKLPRPTATTSSSKDINPKPLRNALSRDNLRTRRYGPAPAGISVSTTRALDPRTELRQKPHIGALRKSTPYRSTLDELVTGEAQPDPSSIDNGGALENDDGHVQASDSLGNRKPRQSLSERTMETLQNVTVPLSPAPGRRKSSFFAVGSPYKTAMQRPPSRPGSTSSISGDARTPSRANKVYPPTSEDPGNISMRLAGESSILASAPTYKALENTTPSRKTTSLLVNRTPLTTRRSAQDLTATRLPSPRAATFSQSKPPDSPAMSQPLGKFPVQPVGNGRTVRHLKPRSSLGTLGGRSNGQAERTRLQHPGVAVKKTRQPPPSLESVSSASATSPGTSITSPSNEDQDQTPRKSSSLALRDQIAKARAAKKAQGTRTTSASVSGNSVPVQSNNFDLDLDPFNQQNQKKGVGILKARIASARSTGRLNIAAMSLKRIPDEILSMYSTAAMENVSWAETVDLTRMIAADNELELLDDDAFPDCDPETYADDPDATGNIFAGLETLDLHGNSLIALPIGLRRLQRLTTLNLAKNKLTNDCFEVLAQIETLRDLDLGSNEISGVISTDIAKLQKLESLDLQNNSITEVPQVLGQLVHLRILNLQKNALTTLPSSSLEGLPLIELHIAKNKLHGVLFDDSFGSLPMLQMLDISCNSLTGLSSRGDLNLPNLHRLVCSVNEIAALPSLGLWESLLTLNADDNCLSSIPPGFSSLPKIKNADFSGNNIKLLDNNIGLMESLDMLRVNGNPLQEKKFSSMPCEELKRALKVRVEPTDLDSEDVRSTDGAFYSAPGSPSHANTSVWPVRAGGVLDRSKQELTNLADDVAEDVARNNTVKVLELHHNKFTALPRALAYFADNLVSLNLSHNSIKASSLLDQHMSLPRLKELDLSYNLLDSMDSLLEHLAAESLESLNLACNRIGHLPRLRRCYPALRSLHMANNALAELQPEAIEGLHVLDCSNNELTCLNPRIGLLGGKGGLSRLDVRGNRFRVPRFEVLDKGTDATLAWLRDRLPESVLPDGAC